MIQKNKNLCFLLALGNQKMVVVNHSAGMHIYSDQETQRINPIPTRHIFEAVSKR